MRTLLALLVLLAAGLGLLYGAMMLQPPRPEDEMIVNGQVRETGPNVVLIIIDALRADRLTAERNGTPVMPQLRALADEGLLFTHAISPASWTRPSVASTMTGHYVDTHGVYFGASKDEQGRTFADVIDRKWIMLAEVLAAARYQTFGMVTNGNLQESAGYAQGFEKGWYIYEEDAPADRVNEVVLGQFLELLRPKFFMYLHYMDPHTPYEAPPAYVESFGPLPEGMTDADRAALPPEQHIPYTVDLAHINLGNRTERQFETMSEAGREAWRHLYDAECRIADQYVAEMVETVRAKFPDTLFIITADHGEEFWEHGGLGHGLTLYQEQIHVPLIILGPDVRPGIVERTVETIGAYRTILEYVGIDPPTRVRGENLLAPGDYDGLAFSRTKGPSTEFEVDLEAMVKDRGKAIRDSQAADTALYDLVRDPEEQKPFPDFSGEWIERLDLAQAENETIRPPRIVRTQTNVSEEHMKMLEQLGYVGPEAGKAKGQKK